MMKTVSFELQISECAKLVILVDESASSICLEIDDKYDGYIREDLEPVQAVALANALLAAAGEAKE